MNTKIIDITEQDALYFVYLSYEMNGYELLVQLFDREEDKIEYKNYSEELLALSMLLIEKYLPDIKINEFYITVDATTDRMEVKYA